MWDESGRGYVVYPKTYSQDVILEVRQQLEEDTHVFVIPAPIGYGSSSYKRLFDAFVEMLQLKLGLEAAK